MHTLQAAPATDSRPKSLHRLLRWYWIATALLSAIAWGFCVCCVFLLGLNEYPYNAIFYRTNYRFGDLISYVPRFRAFHTEQFFYGWDFLFPYPAPLTFVFQFLFRFSHPLWAYFAVAALLLGALIALFASALRRHGVASRTAWLFACSTLLFSYPIGFLIERANCELFVWILLMAALWLYCRQRKWSAAACFGIAAACKLFPILFLGLFLKKRKWRQGLLGLAVFLLTSLFSLIALGPTLPIASRGILYGLRELTEKLTLHFDPAGNSVDHSLFSLAKFFLRCQPLHTALTIYLIAAALAGTLLFFARIHKMPVLNQILALTAAAILLPPGSVDYTLVHLYLPFTLLVFYVLREPPQDRPGLRGLLICFACFALLTTPQNYLILPVHGCWGEPLALRVAGQFKALVLLVLFSAALVYPFRSRHDTV